MIHCGMHDIRSLVYSLTFTSIALGRYWTFFETGVVIDDNDDFIPQNATGNETMDNETMSNSTMISCHAHDVMFIKTYLLGVNGIVAFNLPLLLLMTYCSARGSITDTKARRLVAPLLYLK